MNLLTFIRRVMKPAGKRTTDDEKWSWLPTAFGMFTQPTSAGAKVTPITALNLLDLYACVKVIAETLLQLPMFVMERKQLANGQETKRKAREHPVFRLLHKRANPFMAAGKFRETLMGHVLTWGNGYAEIERNVGGRPIALWPLSPPHIIDIKLVGGQLQYVHRDKYGRKTLLWGYEMFHLAGLGFDGVRGYSPVTMAREAIGQGLAAETFSSLFFSQGGVPPVAIKHPGHLEEEGRTNLERTWKAAHTGMTGAHKAAVLEEGMELQTYGFNPEDSQLLATRRFTPEQMARLYRLPPHKIGSLEHATFSNIEHQGIQFSTDTIDPWVQRWIMEAENKLFTPAEEDRFYPHMPMAALTRGDITTRFAAYATARQWGWMTINDIRALEDLDSIGPAGDVHLVPLNMVSADELVDVMRGSSSTQGAVAAALRLLADQKAISVTSQIADKKPLTVAQTRSIAGRLRIKKTYNRLFTDAASRSVKREVSNVRRALTKLDTPGGREQFIGWLDKFYEGHEDYVGRQFRPVLASYAEQIVGDVATELGDDSDGLPPEIARFADDYTVAMAGRYVGSSRGQLIGLINEAEAAPDPTPLADPDLSGPVKVTAGILIASRLDAWSDNRAAKLAAREATQSLEAIAREAYISAGKTRFQWVAKGSDTCPLCKKLDGKIVGVEESFVPAGTELDAVGDQAPITVKHDMFHPPLHDGCDCHLIAI